MTEVSWKSGRYSASTMPAMTTPMKTSIAGSINVTNRDDLGFDFLVVKVGEAVEHFRQRAGRLADFDHLDRDIGHGLALQQGAGEALAFANPRADDLELAGPCGDCRSSAPRSRAR